MKRWFLLISAKSLDPYYCDEEILQETDLPPSFDLDTLYYYKLKNKDDIGEPKYVGNMAECLEIFEKDMSTSKE